MPKTGQRQTKADKAKYDKARKAIYREERRFTKPLKLFIQLKYPLQYDDFVKFFNLMESTYQGKKDLTKTEMFRKFINNYTSQETVDHTLSIIDRYPVLSKEILKEDPISYPNTSSSKEDPKTSLIDSISYPNTSSSKEDPKTSLVVIEPSKEISPNTSAEPFLQDQTRNIINELVDELFGQGGLDQYIEYVENEDEGIDVNILDELKLDLEPFDFELEAIDF